MERNDSQVENLVFLVFCSNVGYARVVTELPSEWIELNIEKGEWSYKGKTSRLAGRNYPIGVGNKWWPNNEGRDTGNVIGVYDRTSLTHLNQMVHDVAIAIHFD